jgi:hypothetical protein
MSWYYSNFLGFKNYENNPYAGGRYEVTIRIQDSDSNDIPAPFVSFTKSFREAEEIANYLTSHGQETLDEVKYVVESCWQEEYKGEWLEVWLTDNDHYAADYNENLNVEPWGTI